MRISDWSSDVCSSDLCYPAPLKAGSIKLHPCVVWNVPSDRELVKASTAFPLTKAGEELQNPWRQRLRNTATFGNYVRGLATDDNWGVTEGQLLKRQHFPPPRMAWNEGVRRVTEAPHPRTARSQIVRQRRVRGALRKSAKKRA